MYCNKWFCLFTFIQAVTHRENKAISIYLSLFNWLTVNLIYSFSFSIKTCLCEIILKNYTFLQVLPLDNMSNQKAIESYLPIGIRSSSRFVSFVADREGLVIYVNALFLSTYGIAKGDVLQKKLPDLFTGVNKAPELSSVQQKIEQQPDAVFEAETHTHLNNGSIVSIAWEVSALQSETGAIIGFLYVGENISTLINTTQTNTLYNKVLSNIKQAIVVTSIHNTITYWNRFAETLYGWKEGEVLGKNVLNVVPVDASKIEANTILLTLKEGKIWQGEFLVKKKTGIAFPAYFVNIPVIDDDGEVIGFVYTSYDLSDDKKTEDLIDYQKKRLAMFSLIGDKTVNAIVLSDSEGNIEWVNKGFTNTFGYSPEEVLGKRPGLLLRGQDSDPAVVEKINTAIQEKKNYDVEIINYRKNGEPCWIRIQGQPILNDDGSLRGILDITSDITERKKHEEQLVFQAHLLDSIMQAVVVTDLNGNITFWNHFAEKMYGWTKEEAFDKNILIVLGPKSNLGDARQVLSKLHNGEVWEGEFTVKHKNGNIFPIYIVDSPVYDKNNKMVGIMGVSFDITERKLAEEERKKSYSILLKQYKKLKQFAHINAHDLRAPLTNILSISNLIFHEGELLPLQELKSYIRGLDNSAKQMDGVIRKLNSVLHGYQMDADKEFFGSIAAEIKKQVVLIDDDPVQNLINKKVISNHYPNYEIIDYTNAEKALEDIKHRKISPDVVFLDLNMPFMDGWEFLEALKGLQAEFEVQILTSSIDQNDYEKARLNPKVSGINSKPLQKGLLDAML